MTPKMTPKKMTPKLRREAAARSRTTRTSVCVACGGGFTTPESRIESGFVFRGTKPIFAAFHERCKGHLVWVEGCCGVWMEWMGVE